MDIDPIVLLAYVSVSINIITMIAACIAYAIFHIRKRRRKSHGSTVTSLADGRVTPVFLRRYTIASTQAPACEPMPPSLAEALGPRLADNP
jgi:hypothetical protein